MRRVGRLGDDLFFAEQNARLVKNAEAYYRSVFLEEVSMKLLFHERCLRSSLPF
jgi:hypothetical protein